MQVCRVTSRIILAYLVLCIAYIGTVFAIHLNPARFPPDGVKIGAQGISVGVMALLLFMAQYSHEQCDTHKTVHFAWALCGIMTALWILRIGLLEQDPDKFSMWDSFMTSFSMTVVLFEFFFLMFRRTKLNIVFFVLTLLFAVPLLTAVPTWLRERVKPDPTVMKASAMMSSAAYSKQTIYEPSTETAVLSGERDGMVYLAFRGTDDPKNWKTNVNIEPSRVSWYVKGHVKAHTGFYRAYESVRNRVHNLLRYKDASKPIVFCGHSLGGALATLAALDCVSSMVGRTVHVYTFGAPQVGDSAFIRAFNASVNQCVRVVNPHDKIPSVLSVAYMHTKGYYPVTTLSKDVFPVSHTMGAYSEAIKRPRALSIFGMFAPMIYVTISAILVFVFHRYFRGHH